MTKKMSFGELVMAQCRRNQFEIRARSTFFGYATLHILERVAFHCIDCPRCEHQEDMYPIHTPSQILTLQGCGQPRHDAVMETATSANLEAFDDEDRATAKLYIQKAAQAAEAWQQTIGGM